MAEECVVEHEVSGHDFSRAAAGAKGVRALEAAEKPGIPTPVRKNHPSAAKAGAILLDLLAPFDFARGRL
jgi:hypothetical protein